jgi:cytoskeletal protein CcmA (bactofilin family)
MWKPSNQPSESQSVEPERSRTPISSEPQTRRTAAAPTGSQEQATLGKSIAIKGEVNGSGSLYIDGRVEGSINLPGNRVTVGRNGVVLADIDAREIIILGEVRGTMTASDRFDIRSEGFLTGDIVAQRISVEEGAYFKGSIDIRKNGRNGTGELPVDLNVSGLPV